MPRTASLTCPHCHTTREETMQITVVERNIRCMECGERIEAPADTHCVWCAFSDTPCYLVQNSGSCNPVSLTIQDE